MPWRIRGVGGGVLARVHFYLERDGDIERLIADEREREEQKLRKETNSDINNSEQQQQQSPSSRDNSYAEWVAQSFNRCSSKLSKL